MPTRLDGMVDTQVAAQYTGAGTNYVVETPTGVIYCVYVDASSDVVFKKSSDYGLSWSAGTVVFTGTTTQLSVV
jgi:hypothetical protein